MAAGAQRPAGPAPCALEPPRKLLQPRPGPPAGPLPRCPARPPARRPSAQQLLGPAPFLRPPPPPPPGTAPGRSPLPTRGPHSARWPRCGPAPRALNPLAAGTRRGRGRRAGRRARPGSLNPGPLARRLSPGPPPQPPPRPAAFSLLWPDRLPRPGSRPRGALTPSLAGTGSGPGFPTSRRSLLPPREGKGRGGRGRAERGGSCSRMLLAAPRAAQVRWREEGCRRAFPLAAAPGTDAQ